MSATRASLLAAVALAGGVVASSSAQSPAAVPFAAQSFEVMPPRRLPMPLMTPVDSQNVPAGFFSSPSNQPPPPGAYATGPAGAPAGPSSWLAPPRSPGSMAGQGPTVMPLFGRPQTPGKPFPTTAPAMAPAWRWHGYGTVNSSGGLSAVPQLGMPAATNPGLNVPDPPPFSLPMPTPQPLPPGPALPSDTRAPAPVPTSSPPPVEAVPLPGGPNEPSWRPSGGRIGALPANPMTRDSSIVNAAFTPKQSAGAAADIARVAFIPANSSPPAPPSANTTTEGPLVALRSTIEVVCAGRGRDLEMFYRSPNHLLIRLKVRQAADAECVAGVISKLPELAQYHVVYEIAVVP